MMGFWTARIGDTVKGIPIDPDRNHHGVLSIAGTGSAECSIRANRITITLILLLTHAHLLVSDAVSLIICGLCLLTLYKQDSDQ